MRTKALLLFVIACGVSGGRLPTALWQFGEMIRCAQPGVNPLAYNEYGCWCGLGGSGVPVDDVDRCCEAHDKCYQNSRKIPGCEGVFDLPYIIIYSFSCSDRQVYCSAANDKCKAAVCECDRVAAHCFARYTYNPDNKHLDPQLCVSRVAAQSTTCLTQPTSKTDVFLVSERKIKVF